MRSQYFPPFRSHHRAAFTRINLCMVALSLALFAACAEGQPARPSANATSTTVVTNYHSWTNVLLLGNGQVEVLVNPAIGHVQQFRFVGDTNGALWEDPKLFGRAPGGFGYNNYGGDRAWPSPQAAWNWPPPKGFDGSAQTASFTNGTITMISPVDSRYRIQMTRIIELVANQPVMRITTIFDRTAAPSQANLLTNPLGIWDDCQAAATADSRCYVPVPANSIFPNGYTTNGAAQYTAALPPNFLNKNGLISFGMPPTDHQKLGFDGGTLALVGPNIDVRVDAPRVAGAPYPDGNSSTEIYAIQDYFELETLSPMAALPVGGQMKFVTTFTLFHRTEATTDAEAQKVLAGKL